MVRGANASSLRARVDFQDDQIFEPRSYTAHSGRSGLQTYADVPWPPRERVELEPYEVELSRTPQPFRLPMAAPSPCGDRCERWLMPECGPRGRYRRFCEIELLPEGGLGVAAYVDLGPGVEHHRVQPTLEAVARRCTEAERADSLRP